MPQFAGTKQKILEVFVERLTKAHYSISAHGVVYPFYVVGFLDVKTLDLEGPWKDGDGRASCWPSRSAHNLQIELTHLRFANRHLDGYTVSKAPAREFVMVARIYKPAKTAMQSGHANTKAWVLDFEPEVPRQVEPLMGWTSSGDMRQQLRLRFGSKEEAVAYCERHGIAYQVSEATLLKRRTMSYADNFSFRRRDAWTH